MSAMTKKEWMEYLEKTWDAAQKEAWSEPQFECPRCGHCCQAEVNKEAVKLALEALESDPISHAGLVSRKQAITALRQALETEQEPVAWRYALDVSVEGPRWIYIDKDPHQWLQGPAMVNAAIEELHTSPQPSKPWVGLTDEERHSIREWQEIQKELGPVWAPMMLYLYLAVEAKLKEKNDG
jgi:hypothetical protein